ncbi:MAG TPA: hypothetical protein PK771_14895, partial [Spirochaetota bacterium]|nr:hypothetical protein [Spirochaetota bacterium]
ENKELIKNNNLYQVDFEKSMDNIIEHINKLNDIIYAGKSKLFYNDGTGFNNDSVIETKFTRKDNNFKLEFDVGRYVKGLRWDPIEDYFSEIKIVNIYCFNKNEKFIIKEMMNCVNGYKNNELYIFDTIDPIFLIDYEGWIDKIIIEGIINVKPKHFIEDKINYIKHELKLKSFDLNNYEGKISSLYVDDGGGYSDENRITEKIETRDDNSFEIEYNLSDYDIIKKLRFDPLENRICRLKLNNLIYIDKEGNDNKISLSDISYNGELKNDGYIYFETIDPQIYIEVDNSVKTIRFNGICEQSSLDEFDKIIKETRHEIKLKSFDLNNYEGKISSLYIDEGVGYSDDNRITEKIEISDDKSFEIEYDLSNYGIIKRLRFDPFENRICRLKLDNVIYVDSEGNEGEISISDISYNGEAKDDGYIYFETIDPQVYIDVGNSVKRIRFQGICDPFPLDKIDRIIKETKHDLKLKSFDLNNYEGKISSL